MNQLSELKEEDITIQVLGCLVGESSYHQLLE